MRYSSASDIARTQASGSSPFTWKTGASTTRAIAVG